MNETNPGFPSFDDLDQKDLGGDVVAPQTVVVPFFGDPARIPSETIPCPRCAGTGNTKWGRCFKCEGKGKISGKPLLMDAQSIRNREKYKGRATAKKIADAHERVRWVQEHIDVVNWLHAHVSHNDFARSLQSRLDQTGDLSDGQIQAVRRSIAEAAARAQAKLESALSVEGAGYAKLIGAFTKARLSGLKYPTLRAGDLVFTLAGEKSSNQGYVYVKVGGNYQGKITPAGKFLAAYSCTKELQEKVAEVGRDPLAAAVSHGRLTGACACCGRALVDPESVERGIGPICASKFGF